MDWIENMHKYLEKQNERLDNQQQGHKRWFILSYGQRYV